MGYGTVILPALIGYCFLHPDLFDKAMGYERDSVGDRGYTWVDGRPLLKIAKLPEREEIPAPDLTEGCAVCHL